MTTAQFIAKYNGKPIDFDGRYGNQCMDEAAQFVAEVWGKSGWDIAKGFAYQVWTEFNTLPVSKYAHLVANTPSGIPPEGALVVWSTGLGQAGHIAVARAGSTTSVLKTFDQNWNYHQYCEPVDHNYNYVYGWIVLNAAPPAQGEDMINAEQVKDLYRVFLGREASQAEANGWVGPWSTAFYGIKDSAEGKAYTARQKEIAAQAALVAGLTAQVNELKQNPSKADLQAVVDQLKVATDKYNDLLAQQTEDTKLLDQGKPAFAWLTALIKRLKGDK